MAALINVLSLNKSARYAINKIDFATPNRIYLAHQVRAGRVSSFAWTFAKKASCDCKLFACLCAPYEWQTESAAAAPTGVTAAAAWVVANTKCKLKSQSQKQVQKEKQKKSVAQVAKRIHWLQIETCANAYASCDGDGDGDANAIDNFQMLAAWLGRDKVMAQSWANIWRAKLSGKNENNESMPMHYAYAAYARPNSNNGNYRVWKINWNMQSKLCASFDDSTVHSGQENWSRA